MSIPTTEEGLLRAAFHATDNPNGHSGPGLRLDAAAGDEGDALRALAAALVAEGLLEPADDGRALITDLGRQRLAALQGAPLYPMDHPFERVADIEADTGPAEKPLRVGDRT